MVADQRPSPTGWVYPRYKELTDFGLEKAGEFYYDKWYFLT